MQISAAAATGTGKISKANELKLFCLLASVGELMFNVA